MCTFPLFFTYKTQRFLLTGFHRNILATFFCTRVEKLERYLRWFFSRLETATAAVENKLDMRVFTCLVVPISLILSLHIRRRNIILRPFTKNLKPSYKLRWVLWFTALDEMTIILGSKRAWNKLRFFSFFMILCTVIRFASLRENFKVWYLCQRCFSLFQCAY